ncbi:MAG: DUF3244 domain-containing protein [Saprospiraceae bacterium]
MKLQTLLSLLFFVITLNQIQANDTTAPIPFVDAENVTISNSTILDPIDIKVVVAQKRIWLIADEMPMRCLKTQIKNAEGKVVLEKCFTSKSADWFLNIEPLPKGEYTLYLGANQVEKFKK